MNAARPKSSHIVGRLRPVRRQGHEADEISAGRLPGVELIEIRWSDVFGRVRAARTVLRRDMGPFNMDEGDRVLDQRIAVARLRDRLQCIDERSARCRDQRRSKTRNAAAMDGQGEIANRLRIGAAIEVMATKTVQLQIEQSER